jgi:hypothetical protein
MNVSERESSTGTGQEKDLETTHRVNKVGQRVYITVFLR